MSHLMRQIIILLSTLLIICESATIPETIIDQTDGQVIPLTKEEKVHLLETCASIMKGDNFSSLFSDYGVQQSPLRQVSAQKVPDVPAPKDTSMSTLELPVDTKYTLSFLADWNAMRSKDFRRDWKRLLRGREEFILRFPNLALSFGHSTPSIIRIYLKRNGTKLLTCGGFYERSHEGESSTMNISLKMDLFVKTRKGFEITWTQERYISLKRNPVKSEECTLNFEYNDMPWKDMAPRVPRALITIVAHQNYEFRGLPVLPLPSHELFIMNWNAAKSFRNYDFEWKKMLRDDKDAWLHFHPLEMRFVDGSNEVVNLFFGRRRNILKLYGGHYEWANETTKPLHLFFKIDLFLTKSSGVGYFRTQQQGIKLINKVNRGWYSLLVFLDIPWDELSTTIAPRAEITLDETIRVSVFGLPSRPLPMNQPYRMDWNLIKSMKDYQIEWNRLLQGSNEAQLHFFPLEIRDSDNETTTTLVLFLVRRGSHLWLVGGHSEEADEHTKPLPITVQLNLFFKKKSGEVWSKMQKTTTTMNRRYPKGWVSLFPISGIPWQELSHSYAPIAIMTLLPVQ